MDALTYFQEVDTFQIPSYHKDYLKTPEFVNEDAQLYLAYPKLFIPDAEHAEERTVEQLCVAGFLYYKSLILVDRIVDREAAPTMPNLIGVMLCQEQSIKILCELFGTKAAFWETWQVRKTEYANAEKKERRIAAAGAAADKSFDVYCEIADTKAAFAKAALDALYHLNQLSEDHYQKLLQSHVAFSIAYQLIDDISDFGKDLQTGQFNWAVEQLQIHLQQEVLSIPDFQKNWKKYYYASPVGVAIYQTVLTYFQKAQDLAKDTPAKNWLKMLQRKQQQIEDHLQTLQDFQKIARQKSQQSQERIKASAPLLERLQKAEHFILKNQNEAGYWEEYVNQGGISTIWASALIGHFMTVSGRAEFGTALEKGKCFLAQSRRGLWSYNTAWSISDADSTNFAFLTLLGQNEIIEREWIDAWLKFQNEDGGLATYWDRHALMQSFAHTNKGNNDFSGWTNSHACVSAVAYLILAKLGKEDQVFFQRLEQYLYRKQDAEGMIASYWWTSPIYASSFTLSAFLLLGRKDRALKLASNLMAQQKPNGSFGDAYNPASPFYTALAMIPIAQSAELSGLFKAQLDLARRFLLSQQYTDGSWASTAALRVPHFEDLQPDESPAEWPLRKIGTQIRVDEFNRLVTTSVCHCLLSLLAAKTSPQ